MTAECKNYKSHIENDVSILVKKIDEDVVVCTRKKLLEICEQCPEADNCTDIKELIKILK
jgi:hypothetical protein